MRRPFTHPRSIILGATAGLLVLGTCATALAVLPVSGKTYSGYTSLPRINGHRGPVSFSVSSNGSSLLAFRYGTVGCTPVSSFSGNPYTSAANIIKVGTITMSGSGSFSATNTKSMYLNSKTGKKYVTISTIAGKFNTGNSAAGTITFSQKIAGRGGASKSCGPYAIHFTATTK